MYAYFTWFASSEWLGGGYGLDWTFDDVVSVEYIPQPYDGYEFENGISTVTFTEYPPKGWLG